MDRQGERDKEREIKTNGQTESKRIVCNARRESEIGR